MISMIRKLIYLILLFTVIFLFSGGAEAAVKINSILFDNTESSLFLMTNSKMPPDNDIVVTSGKLDSNRVYYDIKNAILTQPNKTWEFKNTYIEKVRLSQFSVDPEPVVRVVFYYKDGFNPDNVKVIKADNIIVFKYNNLAISGEYFFNIYREEGGSIPDYYEPMALMNTIVAQPAAGTPDSTAAEKPADDSPDSKTDYKLKSKYYIDRVDVRQGNILVYGIGSAGLEKTMYLSAPSRVVFDFPNTVLKPELHGKEIQISETETLKLAQFEQTKTRLVITTDSPDKYRPIYSANLQSILIAHDDRVANVNLFNELAPIKDIKTSVLNDLTDVLTISFNAPVIHSIKRESKKLDITLYNTEGITPTMLANVFKTARLSSVKVQKFSQNGYKITIPLKENSIIMAWETLDAKNLKFQIKTPVEVVVAPPLPTKGRNTKPGVCTIVLDPGHGGADVGATRAGIYEKDINLDVSKKVANILINKGYIVEMTHWQDATQSLQERVDIAEAKNADVFVSIHSNASVKPETYGIETHFYHDYSKSFAQVVQKNMVSAVDGYNRGVLQSKFYVINHTTMPAILVEIGFISNDNERNALLSEKRKQATAEGIAKGIIEFVQTLK